MSKKIVLALGGNALGDDLAGQMKAVKITSQAIVDLIAQGHEVIVTHGNGPQVGMINQAFEAAAKTEAHSPMLPMSVCLCCIKPGLYWLRSTKRFKRRTAFSGH